MGRKIILLSDGTGNSAAKVWRTNVWRTFEALDLSGNDQVALYDDGVGTSSFKPMAILGGAFGLGLRRNVIALYKFACRNYRDADDELFGFGSAKDKPQWYERVYLSLFVPLRRELAKDWFRIVLRYGTVGGEEDSYEPDPYDDTIQFNITPTIAPDGKEELFVFVNDAVIGIPGLYDLLYRNNSGSAVLSVTRKR